MKTKEFTKTYSAGVFSKSIKKNFERKRKTRQLLTCKVDQ